jgi:hypothetical protein
VVLFDHRDLALNVEGAGALGAAPVDGAVDRGATQEGDWHIDRLEGRFFEDLQAHVVNHVAGKMLVGKPPTEVLDQIVIVQGQCLQ